MQRHPEILKVHRPRSINRIYFHVLSSESRQNALRDIEAEPGERGGRHEDLYEKTLVNVREGKGLPGNQSYSGGNGITSSISFESVRSITSLSIPSAIPAHLGNLFRSDKKARGQG